MAGVSYHVQGAVTVPSDHGIPDYDWWYGCSPTAAGMMMGYYDRNGYAGHSYSDLVPGGVAELNSYGNPTALVNQAIASSGHIADFYGGGYGASGDDQPAPHHSFDCLADFMGTSQDNLGAYEKDGVSYTIGNKNGYTCFWYYSSGDPLNYSVMSAWGDDDYYNYYRNSDGMYGLGEYVESYGYEVANLYTQVTDNVATGEGLGFTFDDYKAEIDAGRVVLVHLMGHSVLGFGYEAATGEIIFNETWYEGEDRMAWGGSFSGMELWGVTVMELAPAPLPGAVLLGVFGLGTAGWRLRRR